MGTPTVEAKRVQRAVAKRLAASDEPDIDDGSEGLRPGRSPHKARPAWRERCMTEGSGGIVEADGRGDCDRRDRTRRRAVLRHSVKDGRIGRLMGQWLRAGVGEAGVRKHPDPGVGQGGTISPGLANILLHQVLAAGLEPEVQPRLQGRSFLSRVVDDGVSGGAREADARTSRAVWPKRCGRYGVTIHPTKTARSAFRKPAGH